MIIVHKFYLMQIEFMGYNHKLENLENKNGRRGCEELLFVGKGIPSGRDGDQLGNERK
jgi:hypothetical protein